MLIDGFTVGAQLLNFVILVWLMKRFLYQPVLGAIAAGEQKIANELANAATTQAKQQQDTFEQKNQAFDERRADMLQQARNSALMANTTTALRRQIGSARDLKGYPAICPARNPNTACSAAAGSAKASWVPSKVSKWALAVPRWAMSACASARGTVVSCAPCSSSTGQRACDRVASGAMRLKRVPMTHST